MTPIFKRVLFATDLSENSRQAFKHAASLASYYDGNVIILHVMEKPIANLENTLATFLGAEKWQELQAGLKDKIETTLTGKRTDRKMVFQALKLLRNPVQDQSDLHAYEFDEILIQPGKVVDVVIKTCQEKECDVIVIAAHKGFFIDTVIGSTAKGILRQATVPVLIVPPSRAE